MSTPDLLYSDVERDLRASVAGLLTDHCPPTALAERLERAEPYDPALWRTLAAELGLAGLHVPEEFGGQGATTRETAVVLEELGRSAAPLPYLGSAVLATSVLLHAAPATHAPVARALRG
ncbi:acyl-CoA dehydrogenase family protein, partial [Saccharomonospora saliphila]|uniref:acyl-CoA dehydrogenase family protein n=1 Tax=Saccharomonospora saliphila TaxID=369829 RepID=UPI00048B2FE6